MSEHVVIGLLRAVNVGGRKLTSAQLRGVATDLGYTQVATYVNSGNVVLVAPHGAPRVADELRAALSAEAGFDVPVVTRTAERWDGVVAGLPFADEARDDPSHLVVVAWDDEPAATAAAVDLSRYGDERLEWRGTELYAYYPDGIGRSKLTLAVLEKAAGRVGTARNWNTVLALAKLAHERLEQG